MEKEKFWLLVSLKLSGEGTPEELEQLNELLRQFPELGLQLDILDRVWNQKQSKSNRETADSYNKHLQRLSNHLAKPVLSYEMHQHTSGNRTETGQHFREKRRSYSKRFYIMSGAAVAASLILFLNFIYSGAPAGNTNHPVAQNTVSTKPGSKSKLQLPDGTQVWLNGDSKITYDENFLGDYREVQLTGEAYFDVARDKQHPFIIHTQTIDLKVLGTAFNVRSYANEDNTETSLIHGSIEITLKNNPDKKIILKPEEKLIIPNNAVALQPIEKRSGADKKEGPILILGKIHFMEKDSSATETLWVKNKLAFDDESLESIASKIERWYDVKVSISDEKLKRATFSAVFTDESLPVVLEALSYGNFRYTINKKEISIRP
jgi:ferric-dicitrate binding protein FerR (iron transport regulator)